MNGFGDAPVKGEGMSSNTQYGFSEDYVPTPPKVDTTWLEFRLPRAWEDECWGMIEVWLKEKAIQDPGNGGWK